MKFSGEEAPDENRTAWPEAAYIAQRRAIADHPVYLRIANPYRAHPAIRAPLPAGRRERARELRLKASFARFLGRCRSEAEPLNQGIDQSMQAGFFSQARWLNSRRVVVYPRIFVAVYAVAIVALLAASPH